MPTECLLLSAGPQRGDGEIVETEPGSALKEEDRQKPGFSIQREEYGETVPHRGEPPPLTDRWKGFPKMASRYPLQSR